MLTIHTTPDDRARAGFSRRDFICAGSLALGAVTYGSLSPGNLLTANDGLDPYLRDRSVVLLYLSGGASQIETFDPKLNAPAPAGIRSVTGAVNTSLTGIQFGGTYPELGKLAHRVSIIRSFQHPIGGHEQAHVHVLSGGTNPRGDQKSGHSIGSLVARLSGTNSPKTGLPTYTLLTEKEIDGQYRKELSRVRRGSWPGSLGMTYSPFEPGADRSALSNMELSIPAKRFGERNHLLKSLDAWKRQADTISRIQGADKFDVQAIDLLNGGNTDALDLSLESPKLMESYDTSHIQIGHKKFRPSTLGKQMLMARRLCESGCRFVTVHSAGWDMHADGNNPGMQVGMEMLGRSMDKAVSAFLQDVHDRRLSDRILLVITGDFGRTPKVNKKGGRDHWARLCPLLFAGGGLNMGQVVGKSSRDAGQPATTPYTTSHMMSTVLHSLFDLGQLRLESKFPRQLLQQIESIRPIPELVA